MRVPFIGSKNCKLCTDQIKYIDYKNLQFLQRYITAFGKIEPSHRSGNCAYHQRMLAKAIKRARQLALLPYQE
jgi:small subunit ribosomal protein S18